MIAAFVILGLIALGLGIGLIATAMAPAGYQDETGFHYGQLEGASEEIACAVHRATAQPKPA